MGLLADQKAERRDRILAAARRLIADEGYDALSMRTLARESRVSVPTLYNLFGSKDAILIAELHGIARRVAAAQPAIPSGYFQRGMAAFDLGMRLIEEAPEFFRAVVQMVITSRETDEMRRRVEDAFVTIMQSNLAAAKWAGQLHDWAEPMIVARHIFAAEMAPFLAWGLGQIDFRTFRLAAESGTCHVLAGVASGQFHAEVVQRIRDLRHDTLVALTHQEVPDGSRDR